MCLAAAPVPKTDQIGPSVGPFPALIPRGARHASAPTPSTAPCRWSTTLVVRAMRQDWSWSRSAQDYLRLYREVVGLQEGAARRI